MVERFGWRPTGYIGNYPRKAALEQEIIDSVSGLNIGQIQNIYIHGSWARGKAIPFSSDLDIVVEVTEVPAPTVSPGENVPPNGYMFRLADDSELLVFNKLDIWLSLTDQAMREFMRMPQVQDNIEMGIVDEITEEFIEESFGIMTTEELLDELVSFEDPRVVYNLRSRSLIQLDEVE